MLLEGGILQKRAKGKIYKKEYREMFDIHMHHVYIKIEK